MFGTDWPHWVPDTKGAFANTAELAKAECAAIRSENARRVFGL
jgi:aminocarboxymuconate-semialdehyde decarboxylase